jgi:hypothetical protein
MTDPRTNPISPASQLGMLMMIFVCGVVFALTVDYDCGSVLMLVSLLIACVKIVTSTIDAIFAWLFPNNPIVAAESIKQD